MKIQSILSRIDTGVSIETMTNPELLMQLLMDLTSLVVSKVCQVDDNTYVIRSQLAGICTLLCIQKGYNS